MERIESWEVAFSSAAACVRPLAAGLALLLGGGGYIAAAGTIPEGASATAWSAPFSVDTRSGAARAVSGSVRLALDPAYAGPSGATVVLRRVVRPDTPRAATNEVSTATAAGAATVEKGDAPYVRYIHETRDASGAVVGTLAADLAFSAADAAVSGVRLDARTNSLALAVAEGGERAFVYDSTWCTNGAAARLEISRTVERYQEDRLVSSRTKELLAADAPCAGDLAVSLEKGNGGFFTYLLTFRNAAGESLGEPLSATCRFPERWGTFIILR